METDKKTLKIVVGGLLLCAVFGGIYFFMPKKVDIKQVLSALNLIPKKERFTELYFDDFTTLPKTIKTGQEIKFSFTIHNLEGVTTAYPYAVYFRYSTGEKVLFTQGTVSLTDAQSVSLPIKYTFKTSNLNGKVIVDLTGKNQQIDFILPNNN